MISPKCCEIRFLGSLYAASLVLSASLEIVVWIFDTYDNNLEIKNNFTKYLKESWLSILMNIFSSYILTTDLLP